MQEYLQPNPCFRTILVMDTTTRRHEVYRLGIDFPSDDFSLATNTIMFMFEEHKDAVMSLMNLYLNQAADFHGIRGRKMTALDLVQLMVEDLHNIGFGATDITVRRMFESAGMLHRSGDLALLLPVLRHEPGFMFHFNGSRITQII